MQKGKFAKKMATRVGFGLFYVMLIMTLSARAQDTFTTAVKTPEMPQQMVYPAIFDAEQKAVLSAERAGVLTSIKYDVGDSVQKGAVVASVDTGELALLKKRNEVTIQHLDTQVRDLSNLRKQGLATNEDLARAMMERDVSRTDLDIVKRQIIKSSIRAPFQSVVVRRQAEAHEWVTAGQPVVEVVNLNHIRAVANIPAHMAAQLEKGQKHTFYINDLDAEVTGTVFAVAPEVDERSNTAQVIWSIEKGEQKLLPGMKGEVRLDA